MEDLFKIYNIWMFFPLILGKMSKYIVLFGQRSLLLDLFNEID